jgi:hypothetical protein
MVNHRRPVLRAVTPRDAERTPGCAPTKDDRATIRNFLDAHRRQGRHQVEGEQRGRWESSRQGCRVQDQGFASTGSEQHPAHRLGQHVCGDPSHVMRRSINVWYVVHVGDSHAFLKDMSIRIRVYEYREERQRQRHREISWESWMRNCLTWTDQWSAICDFLKSQIGTRRPLFLE